jgi:hypothetical protein
VKEKNQLFESLNLRLLIRVSPFKYEKKMLFDLWNKEYPVNLCYNYMFEFEDYLKKLTDQTHYLLKKDREVIGWCFTFIRDGETWFAIILDSDYHGKGLGNELMYIAKSKNEKLHGWVIDGNKYVKTNESQYISPLGFYLKQNFGLVSDKRLDVHGISAVKIEWSNGL